MRSFAGALLMTAAVGEEDRRRLPLSMLRPSQRGGSLARDVFWDDSVSSNSANGRRLVVPLDHFNKSDMRTFSIRYYVDQTYFDEVNGPITIQMGGESPANGVYCGSRVKQFSALCVGYEHRYYGESMPEGGLSPENMPFLSVEQNLADAALLVDALRHDLDDPDRAVFNFGGSYSGATCAWFRARYPERSSGCISESGVVNAILQYTSFDSHIFAALDSYSPQCAASLHEATLAMERLASQGRAEYVKSVFGGSSLTIETDFYYMIADQGAMMDQYGSKASLCAGLAKLPADPTDEQRIENLNTIFVEHYGSGYAGDCFYNSDCIRNDRGTNGMGRSWRWQKCSELAYLQDAPANNSLRASALTMDALFEQCQYMFPDGLAPASPASVAFNTRFGGASPAFEGTPASNIVFLDYSDDPWLECSPMKALPGMPYCRTDCVGCGHCGAGVPRSKGQHCQDVATSYMSEWLGIGDATV